MPRSELLEMLKATMRLGHVGRASVLDTLSLTVVLWSAPYMAMRTKVSSSLFTSVESAVALS